MNAITPINPCVVRAPDGRVGVLTGRMGMQGVIQFKRSMFAETVPLVILDYLPGAQQRQRA